MMMMTTINNKIICNILSWPSSGVTYTDGVSGLDILLIILNYNSVCCAITNSQLQSIVLSLFHTVHLQFTISAMGPLDLDVPSPFISLTIAVSWCGVSLWWEDGSVIYSYNCFWALPEKLFSVPSPAELATIFYCFIWDFSNLMGQVPFFISPRKRVAQLYPQALGSLLITSYDL
jgi:hypothetical protein